MIAERVRQWDEKGWIGGVEHGRQQGLRILVVRLLERKFGPLSEEVNERIGEADGDTLLEWGDRVLTAGSLEEVIR